MLEDYHVHSFFSDDSFVPMEEEVKYAIELGLNEICFCEHVDYGIKTDLNCPYAFYLKEIDRLKKKYGDRITIKQGIEFGIQKAYIPNFQADFNRYPFDFVILSCHQVDNKEFWTGDFQKGKTQEQYIHVYYNAILEVIKHYKDYSVLGHLDMIKRYDISPKYPDHLIEKTVREIFEIIIKEGKGIEINTSSFQYKLDDLMPSRYFLKLYYDMGGRIITLGSDAHESKRIGDHFKEVKEILKEIGFKEIYTFEKMQPIAHVL